MTRLERAAAMAYRVLLERQVHALPVDPLALLRACRDTQVLTFEQAAEEMNLPPEAFLRRFGDAEAFTLCQNGQYAVVYQAGGNPARLRFTLAHELGHRALGHTGDAADEREADVFASHLLCPRPAIARLAERFSPLTPEQTATACYVSLACAKALSRLDEVQVDPQLWQAVDALFADAAAQIKPIGPR